MRVIVLASQKGGAGKTTLAAHLAVAAQAAGRVVIIDTDPQATLTKWWNARQADGPAMATAAIADLPAQLEVLRGQGFAFCFIDTPPAISDSIRAVIRVADLVLIPVRPTPHDLWAVGATLEICEEEGRALGFVLSQATRGTTVTVQAAGALSKHGIVAPALLHNRVGFATSFTVGKTLPEIEPRGPGAEEVAGVLAFCLERLEDSTPARKRSGTRARKAAV